MSEVTNTSTLREALERIALIAEGQVTQYARAREQVARIARAALAAAPEPEWEYRAISPHAERTLVSIHDEATARSLVEGPGASPQGRPVGAHGEPRGGT